ncbi:hypothetical protein GPECTOR_118g382 [Gonium pectorale]|uniref:Chromo domain-containing protein n=1 Tax=Gonium pectorale TaxID=33097 RepID=A0A150FZZ3_GONPE|nr:hypothetical protein GPECTOR_118g382 [Gonium pectorale]|eukprot:KXZ42785.1 hypothetical protein GPECTOR_118g382 [Gonium pectorale]
MARSRPTKKVAKKPAGVYTINSIMRHKRDGAAMLYYISWAGYKARDNTWEPESNISSNALKGYWERHIMRQMKRRPGLKPGDVEGVPRYAVGSDGIVDCRGDIWPKIVV